ncbi:hypothetical protein [Pseudomonas sp. PICF6]|jgi:hypothetical protein|uniref:hypothetical protein n=1 Tax=Pseudomonas sp. PICF6 TaxID=2664172 RepID=UPI001368EE2E|nr:hypothetical protein [Pseudomonas sp. PICF6]MXR31893.1 hypothetical protein [Pseudomonas sp. PICF6]
MSVSELVSILALGISFTALYFTFKKDAHRIRLTLNKGPHGTSDFISINNDSSFSVFISSVGHLPLDGKIEWTRKICDGKLNKSFEFPVKVDARSTYQGVLLGDYPSKSKQYTYCVQLDCGRTFVISNTIPRKDYAKLKLLSLLSWLSSGRAGFKKNDIHISKYR